MQKKAFLLVQTEKGVTDVPGTLERILGVETVHHVTGPYDAVAIASASEWTAMGRIADEVRSIPGVGRVTVAPAITEALGQQGAVG